MIIRIKNLRLRTIVGIEDWERKHKQDVIVNIEMELDGDEAGKSDDIEDTVNYKTVKRNIINAVEGSQYQLLDKLAIEILKVIMEEAKVKRAAVEVDKPQALRFADSVSVVVTQGKES